MFYAEINKEDSTEIESLIKILKNCSECMSFVEKEKQKTDWLMQKLPFQKFMTKNKKYKIFVQLNEYNDLISKFNLLISCKTHLKQNLEVMKIYSKYERE